MTGAVAGRATVTTHGEAATRALGGAIAAELRGGDVVLLVGELGAGKTALTKGLVAALGGGEVTSPTFTLLHTYPTEPPVAHVDAWRLAGADELADLALDEALEDGAVAVVEWGELAASRYGEGALVVRLAADPEGREDDRVVQLEAESGSWRDRLAAVVARAGAAGLGVR